MFIKSGKCDICGKRRGGKNPPRHDKCSRMRQISPESARIQEERRIMLKAEKATPSVEMRLRKPTSFHALSRKVT